MENSVLRDMEWDAEAGRLLYNGVRYLLVRPEPLAAIYRGIQALGASAGEVLYRAGYEGGVKSGTYYRDLFGQTAEQAVSFMARMGGQIGWGAMTLRRLDLDRRELVLEVVGSPFAEALRPAPKPVCHLIRGVFGGLVEGLLGWTAVAREETCAAVGGERCIFVIHSKGG